jgi:CRISPR-associated protein (TIGR02710 family)
MDIPQRVAQELNTTPEHWFIPDGDYSDTDTIYIGIREVLDKWPDLKPAEIAADVTGGFAPMSVGIAKATHILQLTTIYVRSDYDDRVPIPGTQTLEFPPDPYTVFGHLEAAEAQRLYTAHDYTAAQRIFANLEERVLEPDASEYRAYATLSQVYMFWDVFDWTQAKAAMQRLLDIPFPAFLEAERPRLQAQHTLLQRLAGDNARLEEEKLPLSLLENLDSVLPLLGTLQANAQRRAAQGRYDMAAMFHYRCLELMSQHRLATHNILTERPDFTEARRTHPDLEQRYKKVQREQRRRRTYDLPEPNRAIGLFVGYMLLVALNDPLVQGYPIKDIEERTRARNQSMLAHGFRLINKNEYDQFRNVVEDMLTRFFQVSKQDRSEWEDTCTFLCPFAAQE